MRFFNIGQAFAKERSQQKQSAALQQEAANFKLASDGGFPTIVKSGLFLLFGYYNARLFITTVPGWEGYLTAVFALAGEAMAFYCIRNYTRSAGKHKTALGAFGLLLTLFSVTHATISFFSLENHAQLAPGLKFYAERVAFPLLFGLLLVAVLTLRFTHWRAQIAAEQAVAQVQIASSRARLLADSATMRDESQLERERLAQLEEQIQIENEYLGKLQQFAQLKAREQSVLESIADPELRAQVAATLGLSGKQLPALPGNGVTEQPKPMVTWRGGKIVKDERGN
jgi:hypothetical protein